MANSVTSSTSMTASFYEPTAGYDEKKTAVLRENIKMNLQEICKKTTQVNANMKELQGKMQISAKLVEAIQTRKLLVED